jgi:hypothetical protein
MWKIVCYGCKHYFDRDSMIFVSDHVYNCINCNEKRKLEPWRRKNLPQYVQYEPLDPSYFAHTFDFEAPNNKRYKPKK